MLPELKTVKIGAPAQRAFENAGISTFEILCGYTEKELLELHGVGPKAIRILNDILSAEGLSFKRDAVLTIKVSITEAFEVKGKTGEAVMLFFDGTVDCENFKGIILPGGIDTQKESYGTKRVLSARYILEGTDKSGTPCRVFIENNTEVETDGQVLKTKPKIFTDSVQLSFLETSKLEGTLDVVKGEDAYVLIRIFVIE